MNQSRTLAQGYPLVAVDKEDMSVWAVIGWAEPTVGARYPLLAPLGRDGEPSTPRLPADHVSFFLTMAEAQRYIEQVRAKAQPREETASRPPEHAVAARLAMMVHRDGSMSRYEVDRFFDQVPRETIDDVLAYGHARSWFEVRSDPDRVVRGDVEPSQEDVARDGLYGPPVPEPMPAS
jgi:hypothetical protein